MFRFRIVLAHFVILFAVGIKLVLYRFLIIILLHDNMLLFPLSTNTTIREPFFRKTRKQKTRSFIYVSSIFQNNCKEKKYILYKTKNILIFSYRKNSYFKIINRNEYDLSNAILHTLFYLSTKMNDHNNVFPTYFARSYFNYSSL